MSKLTDKLLFELIRDFFTVYLPQQRCCSEHTIRAYRTALNQLLDYIKAKNNIALYEITFAMLTKERILEYLDWLETGKKCCVKTRNLRLAAIRAFFTYAASMDATVCPYLFDLKKIPKKKYEQQIVSYMSEAAVSALLRQPDTSTKKGLRDQFLMILLYDTAARIQEIIDLRLCDFRFGKTPVVTLHGKGSKIRIVPVMEKTMQHLERYLAVFHGDEAIHSEQYLFYSKRNGQRYRMTTENARKIMKFYVQGAKQSCPDVPEHLHPHLWRHSRAMHLYQHGMDLSLISQWLGHTRMETTLIYAHADTEQKRRAIEKAMSTQQRLDIPMGNLPSWRNDEDLIAHLYGLK